MVYHTFVSGEVLTAANVMNDLMNQSVIVCTSGTRPASPIAGMTVYETDTGNVSVYSGTAWNGIGVSSGSGAWTDYSGSVSLTGTGATLGNGAIYAHYRQVGKIVHVDLRITGGSTSTWGSGAATIVGVYPVAQAGTGSNNDIKLGTRFTQSTNATAWAAYVFNAGNHNIYLNGSTSAETSAFSGLVYNLRFTYEAA